MADITNHERIDILHSMIDNLRSILLHCKQYQDDCKYIGYEFHLNNLPTPDKIQEMINNMSEEIALADI